ncbi:hypothetical protein ABW20_dc0101063 [Dactylellina cionopaga]|nr:hypothetical protein ABW20_dc0101063 [Dactylellina cionopaga]
MPLPPATPTKPLKRCNYLMVAPTTPVQPAIVLRPVKRPRNHLTTPQKAGIQAIWDYCKSKDLPCTQRDLAAHYNKSLSTINAAIHSPLARRLPLEETRGRHPIINMEQLKVQDQIIQAEGWDARIVSHQGIAEELGAPLSDRTIVRYMHKIDYSQCIACQASYLTPEACDRRVAFAKHMLDKYPEGKDWRNVRWSDETHFGLGPEDKVHIWRKDGERHLPACRHWRRNPKSDYIRLHAWAAIGYNFKSDLTFYTTGNNNGKMSNSVYINQILEPIVKPWLEAGHDFVLEEDNDSGHGTGAKSEAARWKQAHNLTHYFNCSQSPDLSIIENAWQVPKSCVRQSPHWDEETLMVLINEGWDALKQESINKWVDSMPDRLQAVIDSEGRMTQY